MDATISLPFSYSPLPSSSSSGDSVAVNYHGSSPDQLCRRSRRLLPWLLSTAAVGLLLILLVCLQYSGDRRAAGPDFVVVSRGPAAGVSEKTSGAFFLSSSSSASVAEDRGFEWSNDMLGWQRTAFHFQPPKNWMNDPNAPLFYEGWYHLFYQYNPDGAIWGNITWGHAVSRDLLRWLHLPPAMVRDSWFDAGGVWTGSATFLPPPDGRLVILYTGSTATGLQVQNLALPADPSDPLLLHWVKHEANPVLLPPPGVGPTDFRDPTTAWLDPADGVTWRLAIGTKDDADHAGVALVYKTKDFLSYELIPGLLHRVAGTGMWECVDFYPVATGEGSAAAEEGLDTSQAPGEGVRHVLKVSLDDDRHDYYAMGTYDVEGNVWTLDDGAADVGLGLRYDWGKFYASKTFYDPAKRRRVLWGWIGETDSEAADVRKGWASLQAIPRTVILDVKTRSNLIQWPVEEVEGLRTSSKNYSGISLKPGSLIPLHINMATQLDIEAEFEMEAETLSAGIEADVGYNCSTSGGATARGMLGPFGLLVLADKLRSEQTAVYFYVSRGVDGDLRTHFCQDESRSSKANDIVKRVVGSTVPVLHGEKLSLRILVDHSIVESFAQQGRSCITSRIYPTTAIHNEARVFLFNNATNVHVITNSLTIWEMNSTFNHPYPTSSFHTPSHI